MPAKLTIGDMHAWAAQRGGLCLSNIYQGIGVNLDWQCKAGHCFSMKPNSVQQRRWCLRCAGKRKTIEDMHALAENRGGRFLSDTYSGVKENHKWKCSSGHSWMANPGNISQGKWCATCAGVARKTIEDMHALAAKRGGLCLSKDYISMNHELEWECGLGHRFFNDGSHIKRGQWCLTCARTGSSYGERVSRLILEAMFKVSFRKIRPIWLRQANKKRGLELDGYAKDLNIAFEYQGEQHYKARGNWFTTEKVNAIQARDTLKRQLCWDHGVVLIVIPEFTNSQNLELCISEIDFAVRRAGLEPPKRWKQPKCFSGIYSPLNNVFGASLVANMRRVASERGGELLSKTTSSASANLQWRCSEGHEWSAHYRPIIEKRSWCAICGNRVRLTIEEMQRNAAAYGGKCLSSIYVNTSTKLEWECSVGHRWKAVPNHIRSGKWCKQCAWKRNGDSQKLTINDMHQTAIERGGRCLSNTYVNVQTKLEWECGCGYRWRAAPCDIRAGGWCKMCAIKRVAGSRCLTIEDMHQIAIERGGQCLSMFYYRNSFNLVWRCAEGHQWKAPAKNVKKGSWCDQCVRIARRQLTAQRLDNASLINDGKMRQSALVCEPVANNMSV